MKTHRIENPAWDEIEAHALPRYGDGSECPAFTLDLIDLARKTAEGIALSSEEQQRHEHVTRCAACRSVYDSGLWFLQRDTNHVTSGQCAGAQLAGPDCPDLERLRKGVAESPCQPVSLPEYMIDVSERAKVAPNDAATALGLSDCGGLDSLNNVAESTVHAVRLVGIDERYARLALKCQCLGLFPDPTLAPRHVTPVTHMDESVTDLLERLIRESRESGRAECKRVDECDAQISRLFEQTQTK